MFGDEKNLKKDNTTLGIVLRDNDTSISYTKTNKLAMALYMVTDIMDKEEPLRNKLRILGTNIVSDTHNVPVNALSKISEIMSFLDIAGAVDLISEMNAGILRKEFFELKQAIEESVQVPPSYSEVNLSELFSNDSSVYNAHTSLAQNASQGNASGPTRLGVQKGSTLLKALKKVRVSDKKTTPSSRLQTTMSNKKTRKPNVNFEVLKGQRQKDILAILKVSSGGATITDIKMKATGLLASCSDKTLQRELIGMLKNGVLKKTGEKRWSRYFLA